ncbi:UNVERIFIED_CONTAM: hypothetical protein DES50_110136 [Williamsia faeni]
MSETSHTPFELVGDSEGAVCVDGVCAVPGSEAGGLNDREGDVGSQPEA